MEAILGFHEIYEIVKVGFKELPKNVYEKAKKIYKEMNKLDYKARVLLHQCLQPISFRKSQK